MQVNKLLKEMRARNDEYIDRHEGTGWVIK
nr:MAG TPA_asm: hypothetical protein [Caudoviricetes sp.]DAX13554.1 MAG TPA: hypothetical protein [Bacteriophage sp.]